MRLFLALYPPEDVLRSLPWRTGREHVTLAFLGEVADPSPLLPCLEAVERHPAPGSGWPALAGSGAGRSGWGLHGDLDRLEALHVEVQGAIAAAGLPVGPEPWRPHLTVGRGRVPSGLDAYEGPEAVWSRVALVHSAVTRHGAAHEPLRTYELKG